MKLFNTLWLGIVLFFLACNPSSQKLHHSKNLPSKSMAQFPEDWLGKYQGNLELFNAQKGKTMELPMTVIISETDTVNRWRWYSKAIFNGKEIIKDYALTRHDSMPKNHFIMDENNGILLDRILLDDAFYDYFEVGNLGLYGITRKVGHNIHFEIASFPLSSKTYSTYKGQDFAVDTVTSFKVINTQKVILKRVKE
ncbi:MULTISPECIES: hypothetical protein [unclassified Aureispira]|uniref:hypothetical protein n=1 Tax=unclassified Aureispira TaxID=2649989 RepID=UPI0012DE1D91|nr:MULTISPECIES: hypothetical protein [unclassified Aureispira]WMX17227.1 hypothetical protein QP953_12665 [Aureispira sp. CCB-E]